MSAGLWDYSKKVPIYYGPETSYRLAADFLGDCAVVEDWGCGACGAKSFFTKPKYVGIDGSPGFADIVEDLRLRISSTDGILMRHVLEHNYDWPRIVENAVKSARRKLAIVCFLEPRPWTELFCLTPGTTIPNLHVSVTVLRDLLRGKVSEQVIARDDATIHKHEWLFFADSS